MAEGKINIIRGKVLIDHGKVQTCRCCGIPCQYCPGATPSQVEIVFADIDYCVCASNVTTSGQITEAPDVGPNGAFTLEQDLTNPCLWIKDFLCATGHVTGYGTTDCTGAETANWDFYSYRVEFQVYTDHYEIRANYTYQSGGFIYPAVNVFSVGEAGEIADPDCPGELGPHANMIIRCAYIPLDAYAASNWFTGTALVGIP